MSKTNEIKQLSVKKLLSEDEYIIPMYQRNYAWDEGEITQLIQDIIDYLPKKNEKNHNYYIGTLIVFERPDGKFETIDGQQRLTTLSLLVSYLKKNKGAKSNGPEELNLHFDSRPNSQKTLTAIFTGQINNLNLKNDEETNTAVLNGYCIIENNLQLKIKENDTSMESFIEFLFNNVQIMRVNVPRDTDLNHYFEIMNNRGEQLEKHEVLKSLMMETLKDEESRNCIHLVWEACANMEKYVQMEFPSNQRESIFGKNLSHFNVKDFEELREKVTPPDNGLQDRDSEQTLDVIISQAGDHTETSKDDESPEHFNTVISFPNFLLHVLRIQTEKNIPLDDKRLISTFKSNVLEGEDAAEKVKKFTFALLRCKFLYDQYIIKREFVKGADKWSLKRLFLQEKPYYKNTFGDEEAKGSENRRILMLLSAFHVSNPSQNYKYWLDGALLWLFKNDVNAKRYLTYLEGLAKTFVFDRFLSANGGLDYFTMIFDNEGVCQTTQEIVSKGKMKKQLSFGNIENNLLFNYLDYLLWVEHQEDDIIKDYEFTFRSSVEHFYPQHPLPGYDRLKSKVLNSFGNLCLISHSKNSRLSNSMPKVKKEHYQNNTIDSVKQHIMMRWETWNENSIVEHYKEMKSVLLKTLEPAEGLE